MWQRYELKNSAKDALKICYWKAVLVSFIFSLVMGSSAYRYSYSSGNTSSGSFSSGYIPDGISSALLVFFTIFLSIFFIAFLIGIAVNIFLIYPLEVGGKRFFVLCKDDADLSNLIFAFQNSYLNIVKTLFFRSLFVFLWSLLFLIPGIVKGYEYRMIPYILAENPHIDRKEAFDLSRKMMSGEKWNTFVLDLSFLGWLLLTIPTCGILGLFYVSPYIHLTNAELYKVLKNK